MKRRCRPEAVLFVLGGFCRNESEDETAPAHAPTSKAPPRVSARLRSRSFSRLPRGSSDSPSARRFRRAFVLRHVHHIADGRSTRATQRLPLSLWTSATPSRSRSTAPDGFSRRRGAARHRRRRFVPAVSCSRDASEVRRRAQPPVGIRRGSLRPEGKTSCGRLRCSIAITGFGQRDQRAARPSPRPIGADRITFAAQRARRYVGSSIAVQRKAACLRLPASTPLKRYSSPRMIGRTRLSSADMLSARALHRLTVSDAA